MDSVPTHLGPYEIRGKIGAGGMGVVYRGWDARLKRAVALKTLLPSLAENPGARERFLREARAAAAVSHPNVTQIHDIGRQDGCVYFAMEYLEGRSLLDLLGESGKLTADEAIALARQAAAGLGAAAKRGIVHRDIKPSNLFLTADGTLKITDFGLAKDVISDKSVTVDGQFLGTPYYVSPEQASGKQPDARSDIYSLGATLYEMLTGRPPFEGDSAVTVVMKHLREPVPPLRELNPAVPVPLAMLIQKMLSKNPGARPQDYEELLERLDRLSSPPTATTSRGRVAPSAVDPGAPRRTGFAARLFGVALLGVAALVVVGVLVEREGGSPPADAGAPADRAVGGAGGPAAVPALPRVLTGPAVAAAGGPVAPATTERADLKITRTSNERTEDGLLRVFGEVTNGGGVWANAVTLRVVLTDDEGNPVDSLEVPVVPPRLDAGESGRFEAFFPDPGKKVGIMLELNWMS